MKTAILITMMAVLITATNSFSQEKFEIKEIKHDKTFQVSGKSRTLKMKKGDSYNVSIDLKKDKAYYISVSGHKSLSAIQFKIVSNDGSSEVFYDNSAYEFSNQTMVTVKDDSKVILEINTQPSGYFASSSQKKDVELFIASKKMKSSSAEKMSNMIVLASNN